MPTMTSSEAYKPGEHKMGALIGSNMRHEDFDDIVKGFFSIDEKSQQKFRNRINIKGYKNTSIKLQEDTVKREREVEQPPVWLLEKVSAPKTEEYLAIRRGYYIATMIKQIQEIKDTLKDEDSLRMSLAIFKNEIYAIYKTFLEGAQDEHFLSLVSLFEDVILKKEVNDKVLKECTTILKTISQKNNIEYSDYENVIKRFSDQGIDYINIEEVVNEK